MFFLDLDPNPNNKQIYDLRYINNAVVKIEPQRKINDIVQCHRCQQYGHTKAYCRKPFACVKCGLNHSTAECKKSIDAPPKCIHCLNNHTANYKGCKVYQALRQKTSPSNRNQRHQQFSYNQNDFPQFNSETNAKNTNFSTNAQYSQVLRQNNSTVEENSIKNIENMFGQLMNMLTLLINKLCN